MLIHGVFKDSLENALWHDRAAVREVLETCHADDGTNDQASSQSQYVARKKAGKNTWI